MHNQTKAEVKSDQFSTNRVEWITKRALTFVRSQGYSEDTAYAFAAFAIDHCPEVQGFANLFDYFMTSR